MIRDLVVKIGCWPGLQSRSPPGPSNFAMDAAFPWVDRWTCPFGLQAELQKHQLHPTVIRFQVDDFSDSAHAGGEHQGVMFGKDVGHFMWFHEVQIPFQRFLE
jgi:hypothetical protein